VETDIRRWRRGRKLIGFDAALDEFSAQLARQQIFWSAATRRQRESRGRCVCECARGLRAFTRIQWQLDTDRQRAAVYLTHRGFLMSPNDRRRSSRARPNRWEGAHFGLRTPTGLCSR
jgi:hypothetical protein